MAKVIPEKPQKGNPHQLTVNQHVFPVRSIERFTGEDKRVCVYLKSKNIFFRAIPEENIFCANRVWDQRAEAGYMKGIEDKFQVIAEAIIEGKLKEIGIEEMGIITDFWILWYLRAEMRNKPLPDTGLHGVSGDPEINKDRQEYLEKRHIGCVRSDGTIPGRDITGMHIQLRFFALRKQLAGVKWGIIIANDGEFIVPDTFFKDSKRVHIVPLSPTYCLVSPNQSALATIEAVRQLNRLVVECSQEYYFARDFSKCPL